MNHKSAGEHALIKRLWVAGATNRQIEAITGFAPATVYRHICMFRDYIKCQHDEKRYLCKECRCVNAARRKPLDQLRREVGL